MRQPILLAMAIAVLLFASEVRACPYCDSEVGQQVADGIFNQNFGYHALLTLLPIPILLLLVGLIHFGFPWSRQSSSPRESSSSESSESRPFDPRTEL